MDDTYLHRLSRPYRRVADASAPRASGYDDEPLESVEPRR